MPRGLDRIKLEGQQFGEWEVLEYLGNRKYKCRCSCGAIKEVHGYQLRSGKTSSCGHEYKSRQDIVGKTFGEWTVLEQVDEENCLCRCSCGVERKVSKHNLQRGGSKSCGHNKRTGKDLTGQRFGDWVVLRKDSDKTRYWICRCSCGKEKSILDYYLTSGKSKSCGHSTTGFKDLTGQHFGEWEVLEYAGNRFWKCKCSCGTVKNVHSYYLITGQSKSCGCKSTKYSNITMLERYGDTNPTRINNPRQLWQIQTIQDDNAFKAYVLNKVSSLNRLVLISEIASDLDVSHDVVYRAIVRNNLTDVIDKFSSKGEREVYDEICRICSEQGYSVQDHVRDIIKNSELDIYIPQLKIAIEFNGSYWHSDNKKGNTYHQNKTIKCKLMGIRLIHIFEYEWNNQDIRQKIIEIMSEAILKNSEVVYARNCSIQEITRNEALEFLSNYHLQGYTNSEYNYGLFIRSNRELIGVMTFGKPRFSQEYQYELIRLCWKPGITVIGGAEKLFKNFIDKKNPKSIVAYSDASKFTGKVYSRLGFRYCGLTVPNYKWVNKNKVLTRYQTQKQKLISCGFGSEDQTEDEIMSELGYLKIYDCGNYKFEYYAD